MQDAVLQRIKDFQKLLKKANLDGYVCAGRTELHYFLPVYNDTSDEVLLLITRRAAYAFARGLLQHKLALLSFLQIKVVAPHKMGYLNLLAEVLDFARKKKLLHLAFCPKEVDFELGEKMVAAGFHRFEDGVRELRKTKYADELACLSKACQIAAEAFEEVKPQIKTGMSEVDVKDLIAVAMVKRGANAVPFNIVCFGENTYDCHHEPTAKRKLKKNDSVLMDFGCFYKGYCSDMTRSWWHGDKEPAEYNKIWHIVKMAKDAAEKQARARLPAAEVDKAARSIIEDAGYGGYFIHTTGHGVGLNVHEAPILRKNAIGTLEKNMVITIEPGIYLPGKFGVRLEDSYLVTKDGCKNLTQIKRRCVSRRER